MTKNTAEFQSHSLLSYVPADEDIFMHLSALNKQSYGRALLSIHRVD